MTRILVVEDDNNMRRFLTQALSDHGFSVLEAFRCSEAELELTRAIPDLVLLDLGMPDGDGTDLLSSLRQRSRVPVIIISGREHEQDKVAALDAGADDYLTKPFGIAELLARIRVALRHARDKRAEPGEVIRSGTLEIDPARHVARLDGAALQLTPIEFKLLAELARNPDRVLTHRQLLLAVWGEAAAHETHYVRVQISSLRRKLERDPARPRLIVTEQGIGYRLRTSDEPALDSSRSLR